MNSEPRFPTGSAPPAFSSLRRPPGRRPVLLAVLAVAAMAQAGCQSGPFGGWCNGCQPFRPFQNWGPRIFQSNQGACCGGELGSGVTPLPYGPGVVTAPPAGTIGTTIPGTTSTPGGSNPTGEPADKLDPIPPSSSVAPADSAKTPATGKARYEAKQPSGTTAQAAPA